MNSPASRKLSAGKMQALVFAGGMLGTLIRFGLVEICPPAGAPNWVGVLTANVTATFLAAWIGRKYLLLSRAHLADVADPFQKKNPKFNLFFVTGCMGGLSTFSSLSQDLCRQLSARDMREFTMNLGLSIVLGIAAAICGLKLGSRGAASGVK